MQFEFSIQCSECGTDLSGSLDVSAGTIMVAADPCSHCMDEAREEGEDAAKEIGYDNGYEEGKTDGYNEGKIEGLEEGRAEAGAEE